MSDLFDEFRRFQETMNRMFEEQWGVPAPGRLLLPPGERAIEKYERPFANIRKPFVDMVETDKEIIATAEMPGLEKEDIKINLTEDKLEISAETRHEEEKREKGYVYKERRSGSYYRAISLPSPVDSDNSKASYNNGVLEIKMPKTEIKKKTPVTVE
ncbi:MAG: Hsp20/alpha crystallin family protein [Candidatus Methanoperedens sp.]|nr:Hsp20/alpha crystallin family protein [Candidatus Methanoperedens sp.]